MLERLEMVKVRRAELLREAEISRRGHGAPKQRRVPGTQVLRAAGRSIRETRFRVPSSQWCLNLPP